MSSIKEVYFNNGLERPLKAKASFIKDEELKNQMLPQQGNRNIYDNKRSIQYEEENDNKVQRRRKSSVDRENDENNESPLIYNIPSYTYKNYVSSYWNSHIVGRNLSQEQKNASVYHLENLLPPPMDWSTGEYDEMKSIKLQPKTKNLTNPWYQNMDDNNEKEYNLSWSNLRQSKLDFCTNACNLICDDELYDLYYYIHYCDNNFNKLKRNKINSHNIFHYNIDKYIIENEKVKLDVSKSREILIDKYGKEISK